MQIRPIGPDRQIDVGGKRGRRGERMSRSRVIRRIAVDEELVIEVNIPVFVIRGFTGFTGFTDSGNIGATLGEEGSRTCSS